MISGVIVFIWLIRCPWLILDLCEKDISQVILQAHLFAAEFHTLYLVYTIYYMCFFSVICKKA